jgi:hypothetical protein
MELKTFSCYDNFVACDKMGSPVRQDGGLRQDAVGHLHRLLMVRYRYGSYMIIRTNNISKQIRYRN